MEAFLITSAIICGMLWEGKMIILGLVILGMVIMLGLLIWRMKKKA